jgi:hypothetical protein
MSTAAAVISKFETDAWKANLYESLSLAARLSMAVKRVRNHAQHLKISYLLWKINRDAARFFSEVDDIVAAKADSVSTEESATPEQIRASIDTLVRLGVSFNAIYEESKRRRLLNNSLVAGPVTALRANADQFFEMAEWFDLLLNAERTEQTFADADAQRAKGDVYDLSQV